MEESLKPRFNSHCQTILSSSYRNRYCNFMHTELNQRKPTLTAMAQLEKSRRSTESPSSQLEKTRKSTESPLSQFEKTRKSTESPLGPLEKSSRRSTESPLTPATSPTFEQYLRAEDAYWSTTFSPSKSTTFSPSKSTTFSPSKSKHHQLDQEKNANSTPTSTKKSVLAKVKERAKKLKHSLSGKKGHGMEITDTSNSSPTSTDHVTTVDDDHNEHDDDDDDENEQYEDPEYLGAPMYESEAAPEVCKEMARQHPRAIPVVSEKHILPDSMKNDTVQGNDKSIAPNATKEENEKPNNASKATQENEKPIAPNKTVTETVTEKLAPAYAAVSDATHTIASKIANLAVTAPLSQETAIDTDENLKQFNASSSQNWDKGISVKEYFMDALEPGDDDKALSEAITDAISPRSSAMAGSGVVEKVKGAVTSLFWNEGSSPNSSKVVENASTAVPSFSRASSDNHLLTSHVRSSDVLRPASARVQPVSTKYHEAVEDENHGKILQTN